MYLKKIKNNTKLSDIFTALYPSHYKLIQWIQKTVKEMIKYRLGLEVNNSLLDKGKVILIFLA